jgi:carboxymethylenebutenolidase
MNQNQLKDAETLLTGAAEPTRRSMLQTAAAASAVLAAAVSGCAAPTRQQTSATGLDAGNVLIDINGFAMPAYRAAAAGKSNLPVVLVVSEIFGVHAHIADVARRLAHEGYLAIAPSLFVRQGDAGSYTEIPKLMREVIAKVPDAQVMADLDATVRWAASHGGDTSRLGITGFCWGGRITWLYAAHNPAVKAGVAWYGRLAGDASPLAPRHPVDVAGQLHGPVLGLYGGADTGIPLDTVERMKTALQQAGAKGNRAAAASSFVVYPDAPHAFHADYRPSYREAAARDGWKRMLAWFRQHGVA